MNDLVLSMMDQIAAGLKETLMNEGYEVEVILPSLDGEGEGGEFSIKSPVTISPETINKAMEDTLDRLFNRKSSRNIPKIRPLKPEEMTQHQVSMSAVMDQVAALVKDGFQNEGYNIEVDIPENVKIENFAAGSFIKMRSLDGSLPPQEIVQKVVEAALSKMPGHFRRADPDEFLR